MNEIDPDFNNAPLTSDVEDYTPQYFFINGKAHPDTDDIAANPGDAVLIRAANLGIRDRALGLLNLRMNVIGNDSHAIDSNVQASVESKLLTPGQVADVTTIVDPSATIGTQFAVLDLSRHLNNSGEAGVGGALTFIDVVSGPAPAGNSVAKVTGLSPATNDGSTGNDITVDVTFSGGTTSAAWFLDTIDGAGHAITAADGSAVVTVPIADVLGDGALTGDHVLWIQPYGPGIVAGTASGDVFTLAREGPSAFALTTDPHFANLAFNKVDLNPPGSTTSSSPARPCRRCSTTRSTRPKGASRYRCRHGFVPVADHADRRVRRALGPVAHTATQRHHHGRFDPGSRRQNDLRASERDQQRRRARSLVALG